MIIKKFKAMKLTHTEQLFCMELLMKKKFFFNFLRKLYIKNTFEKINFVYKIIASL